MYVYLCGDMCMKVQLAEEEKKENARSLGAKITGDYEQNNMIARSKLPLCSRILHGLNCRAISPAPGLEVVLYNSFMDVILWP